MVLQPFRSAVELPAILARRAAGISAPARKSSNSRQNTAQPVAYCDLQAALRGSCEIVVGCVGLIRIAGNLGEYYHKDRTVSGIWAALSFSNATRHSPGVLHAILFLSSDSVQNLGRAICSPPQKVFQNLLSARKFVTKK